MALHLVALPHTRVSPEFNGCAYTAKALKFCRMMGGREDVILYAPEGSTRDGTVETVDALTDALRVAAFGPDDPYRLPAWPTTAQAHHFNMNAAKEILIRYAPGDLILLTAGWTHEPIRRIVQAAHPEAIFCEPGVGYEGIFTDLCAFESHAWRHYVYAKQGIENGRWFDTVIPNYFDPDEFLPATASGSDYLLFLGRVIPRKGPTVALEVAHAAGMRLVVAGAGAKTEKPGRVTAGVGTPDEVRLEGDVTYVGPVNIAERAELLAGARALLAPTAYIEPFGGVAVEAMMAGCPAITSDWGAFTETVEEGVTGYRFRTLREGVEAVQAADLFDRVRVQERARERFSLAAVGDDFGGWFARLRTLHAGGWYEMAASSAKLPV